VYFVYPLFFFLYYIDHHFDAHYEDGSDDYNLSMIGLIVDSGEKKTFIWGYPTGFT